MFPLTTTLNRIQASDPCYESWQAALQIASKIEPDDEPISYEVILDAFGIEKALWYCRAEKQHANLWRRYAVWCARQVQHLMTDARSIAALDIAEQHATGLTTDTELAAAEAAAWDAAWPTTGDSWDVAWPTAGAAASASPGFTMAAARGAAEALAWDAAKHVAGPAWDIAWASARGAAWEAESAAFRQLVTTGTLPEVPHA